MTRSLPLVSPLRAAFQAAFPGSGDVPGNRAIRKASFNPDQAPETGKARDFNGYVAHEIAEEFNGKQGLAMISQFGYEYDVMGRITRWDHQVGSGDPRRVVPEYDRVSQLVRALTSNPATSQQIGAEANPNFVLRLEDCC